MIYKKYRRLLILIFSGLLGLLSTITIPAWSHSLNLQAVSNQSCSSASPCPQQNADGGALDLARDGERRYNAGDLEAAAQLWQQAAESYEKIGDREGMTKSLINKSQALQDLGLYPKACKTLLQVFAIPNPNCSASQIEQLQKNLTQKPDSLTRTQAIGLQSLGDVLRRQGLLQKSQEILQLSLSSLPESPAKSAVLLSLGNTERALGNQIRDRWDYDVVTEIIDRKSVVDALAPYQKAVNYYQQAANIASVPAIAKVQAQLNHFQLLLETQKWWNEQTNRRIASWTRFSEAKLIQRAQDFNSQLQSQLSQDTQTLQNQIPSQLATLTPNRAGIYAQINYAESLLQSTQTSEVESLLKNALQQARTLQDKRAETYALGYLGKFYRQQGELTQATQLTQQALLLSQEQNITGDAREITYLWQSQLGGLLRKQGNSKGAIAAYTAAFNTLQSLRSDLNANNQDVQFDFIQEVKPVYLELVDLLLKSNLSNEELNYLIVPNPNLNRQKAETKKAQDRLELARRVIESLQLAELDNFFQDPCSETTNVAVQIDNIDPSAAVIYPIVLPDRIEVILSLAGKPLQEVKIPIQESAVNETLDRLYDYLDNSSINNSARNIFSTSNPNPRELKENIETLLPIFAEVYNWLIKPFENQFNSNQIQNLVFVLNGRLQRVPIAALYDGQKYLIEKYSVALVPSLQLISPQKLQRQNLKVLAAGVSEQIKVQGEFFAALVNVPKELEQIKQTFPGSQKLLNQEFTAKTIQKNLQQNYPVVHLATHGLFSSNPLRNFIITGDGQSISIDELSNLLKETGTTVELLVLSACETATGDERAVLGLAGMAVRSGARSTLASLWPVGDTSTAVFMGEFYQHLKQPGTKQIQALRKAQLSLLESLKSNPTFPELKNLPPHPYYWAPYVLVGNWQ
ncbi:CHAT domain-containing protein [Calothrix sp. FACHB-1219]|uniref:CHAT domain-containing protein n=1 Tax=unclassified Calothrix TaxID=2619626 RepID=UPI0016830A9F|nr:MULTISPECIES: CHAT domain-containing protein [unclassified Calothrix]MBD2201051.1 CHAT domain-containing protein [Calothrix sp. FACHB-168]MBD2215484.1 CHAT domain-containing protein [Calothrix sp. FACHB-1219]